MKTKLFLSSLLLLSLTNLTNAQSLIDENFDNYTIGNLSSDLSGSIPGQGNWLTEVQIGGKFPDFQIKSENTKGNILQITTPITPSTQTNNSAKFAWKNLPGGGWQNRNSGNDILRVEFEFYTGNSRGVGVEAYHRNITSTANGTIIAGFQYETETGRFRGMTRLIIQGVPDLKFILFGPNQTDLYLKPDTWVKVYYQIDYANDLVYFQIPSENIAGSVPTVSLKNDQPAQIYFAGYMLQGNMEVPMQYDNYKVSAVKSASLSTNEVSTTDFNVYPNPVDDIINITNNENVLVEKIDLYDTNSRLILTKNFDNKSNVQIDLSFAKSGIYMIHIKTDQGILFKKIMKK